MKKVDVILGLQWGDEGKGKVVDVLTPRYEVVARFQGGPNAGHTLEFNGEKYVLRSIPSGIFQGGKTNIIGNGVVIDAILFREEAEALAAQRGFPSVRVDTHEQNAVMRSLLSGLGYRQCGTIILLDGDEKGAPRLCYEKLI